MTQDDIEKWVVADWPKPRQALVSRLNKHANFHHAEEAADEAISGLLALSDGTAAEIISRKAMDDWLYRKGRNSLKRLRRWGERFRSSLEVEQAADIHDDSHRWVARVVKELIKGLPHPFPDVLEFDPLPTLELVERVEADPLATPHANLVRLILAVRPKRADWQASIADQTRFLSNDPEMAFMLLLPEERRGAQTRGIRADTFLAELIRCGEITPHGLDLRTAKLVKRLEDRRLEKILDGQIRAESGVTLRVAVHLADCQFGGVEGLILEYGRHGAIIDVREDTHDQKLAKLEKLRGYPLLRRDERRGEKARRTSRPPRRLLADPGRGDLARHIAIALLIGGHDAVPRKLAKIGEELVFEARIALEIQVEERAKDDEILEAAILETGCIRELIRRVVAEKKTR